MEQMIIKSMNNNIHSYQHVAKHMYACTRIKQKTTITLHMVSKYTNCMYFYVFIFI